MFYFACRAHHVLFTFFYRVCEMWGKWSFNCYFVRCCFQNLFKIECNHNSLWSCHLAFSPSALLKSSSTEKTKHRRNFHFILSKRWDFRTVDNLSIAVHILPMPILTPLSVQEKLYNCWPSGWNCRIHRLHLCSGVRLPQRVFWI